ncbi:MAG: thioredoxin fold domain-containing protein [Betaproteobacteria bacterium]|nr:thioredoxin fold domain-containing protein [Betaproteobacteria bacterium]
MIQRMLSQALVGLLLVSAAAYADEASVKAAFTAKFPKAKVESVHALPDLGLYEIVIPRGSEPLIIYTDENFRFMMQGSLVDTKTMTDLTEQTRNRLTAIDFDSLPLDRAIKKVKGDGSRKFAIFSDPDCPYCRRIEQELEKLDNVTIYVLLYPIEQLHPKAVEHAKAIWCSPNRVKAWDDYMLRGVTPTAKGDCPNPVADLVAYGARKGVNGTPTLVFADGTRVPGALNASQLETQLANAAKASGK